VAIHHPHFTLQKKKEQGNRPGNLKIPVRHFGFSSCIPCPLQGTLVWLENSGASERLSPSSRASDGCRSAGRSASLRTAPNGGLANSITIPKN